MITLSVLLTIFVAIGALQFVLWVLGLVFKLLGWTIKMSFSLLGLLLTPVWLVLVVVFGLASAAWWILPLVLVGAFVSGAFSEE